MPRKPKAAELKPIRKQVVFSVPYLEMLREIGDFYRKSGESIDPLDPMSVTDLCVSLIARKFNDYPVPPERAPRGGVRPGVGRPRKES